MASLSNTGSQINMVPVGGMTYIPEEVVRQFLENQALLHQLNHPKSPAARFSHPGQLQEMVGHDKFEEWRRAQEKKTGRSPTVEDFVEAMGPVIKKEGASVVFGSMSYVKDLNRPGFIKAALNLQTILRDFGGGNPHATNPHLVQAIASPGHDLNSVQHWQDCMMEDLMNWAFHENAVMLPPAHNMHTGKKIIPINSSHGTYLEVLLMRSKGGSFYQMRENSFGNLEIDHIPDKQIDRMLSRSPLIKKWEQGEIFRTDKDGSHPLRYKEETPAPGIYVYGVDPKGQLLPEKQQKAVEAAAVAHYRKQGKDPELLNPISWERIVERRAVVNKDLVYERPEGLRLATDEVRAHHLNEDQKRIARLISSQVIVLTPGWEKSKWGAFVAGVGEQVIGAKIMEAVPAGDGGWTIGDMDLPAMRKNIACAIHRQAEISTPSSTAEAPSLVAQQFPENTVRPRFRPPYQLGMKVENRVRA